MTTGYITAAHGLSAYQQVATVCDLSHRLTTVMTGVEILAARRKVPLLIVDGSVDLWDILDGDYLDPLLIRDKSADSFVSTLAAAFAAIS